MVLAVAMEGVKGPAVVEIKALHDAGDELRGLDGAIVVGLCRQHPGWLDAVCLNVINLKAQALKANNERTKRTAKASFFTINLLR